MRWKIVLALSMCLDLLSWMHPWRFEGAGVEALVFGLSHGGAALGVAWGGVGLLGPGLRAASLRTGVLLFATAACLPFVGVPAAALCLLLPSRAPASAPAGYRILDVPGLPECEGRAEEVGLLGNEPLAELRHGTSADRRLALLLATRSLGDACAVRLQGAALKDPADEVRLLAYGFLEARERALYARLQSLTEALERAAPEQRGPLHLERAQYGWELAFLGLAQGELGTHVLREARLHAEEAARLLPHRGGVCLLLARILLRMGEVEAAARALEEARRRGLAPAVVAPYEAEVAFLRRRFGEVRTALEAAGSTTGMRPRVERLEDFWR